MRRLSFLLGICLWAFQGLSQPSYPILKIIPAPASVEVGIGYFKISTETKIAYENQSDREIAMLFQSYLKSIFGIQVPIQKSTKGRSVIYFSSLNIEDLKDKEGYEIIVSSNLITLRGQEAGLFYALQTLFQLLPAEKTAMPLVQVMTIKDEPRYSYRGMHLDVSRHLFPVSFIKKYIDFLAAYKLNNFHWHLTDDQGWRIEIKKYPKLTNIGSYRSQTLIGRHNNGPNDNYDNIPYGGFYTQEEIKDVVAYARERYVNIIPEIEMPGHALAALAAYPELACGNNPGPFKVAAGWGVFDDVFCAGKERTFKVLEDILEEVIQLFPSKYIHIGGDESPKVRWETCVYCQKRVKEEKLKNEHELQSYFIQRIEKYVSSKGRKIIGWDEILEGGLAPNATVMSWRGDRGGIEAAKQHHDVIMTAHSYGLYFDLQQSTDDKQEPLNIGGFSSLEKVYASDPTPKDLTEEERKYILGVQANLWTEYIKTPKKIEYMLFPRLYALAEIAWSDPSRKDWHNFSSERVAAHLSVLDQNGTLYRVPEVIGLKDTLINTTNYTFKDLKPSVKGGKIYYTIDGFNPGDTDLEYKEPVKVSVPHGKERIFKAVVISPSGRKSNFITVKLINNSIK